MEYLMRILFIVLALVLHGKKTFSGDVAPPLVYNYYKETCPFAEEIIRRQVEIAVLKEPRVAASLLRLHFHDCFVMGCDASVLLDDFEGIVSEKQATTNLNSLRGFEVIDNIKYYLGMSCPCTVSCADILAIAARDAVHLRGGPNWEVLLGRRDSLEANLSGANKFIPAPNSSLETLVANFDQQGLDVADLVALSGSHTMGQARCVSFRQRAYDAEFFHEHYDRYKRYTTFRRILRSICPASGKDHRLAPLDLVTPAQFDNHYFHNLLQGKGLLGSDTVLISQDHEGVILKQVLAYASDEKLFFDSFVKSIVKMGNINVLTGNQGEIRRNCRFVNT
ncbi:peroxidase 20 [Humulus lupulus]|uniref:peroxidase 20 n=1 Tax=Humulus lupulus TaxID=3486 RepID=UPI002B41113C|nr:peroxidase 20 [Humulus lupulus]